MGPVSKIEGFASSKTVFVRAEPIRVGASPVFSAFAKTDFQT
jgi:hypothetical protein